MFFHTELIMKDLQLIDELLVVGRGRDEAPDEKEGPAHQRRRLPEGVSAAASCATPPLSATEEPVEVCPAVGRHHNNNTDEF